MDTSLEAGGDQRPPLLTSLSEDSTSIANNSARVVNDPSLDADRKKLQKKRKITIAAIALIFSVAAAIMIFSVAHDVKKSASGSAEYSEFTCSNMDRDCITLLCPEGHTWNSTAGTCTLNPGFQCCMDTVYIKRCWKKGDKVEDLACVDSTGVVPGSYREMCRPGYLWIEWKGKCFMKN